ncbi:uncharacterized protein LOC112573114 [Pomacea canaliculata]|uniref:uncharacterized protein LOC112573114 n=1 Tax=Pomacea canaliculata TaxID=400727 RepID=UPI000D728CE8|nr:uncharacterized protein LOC112573114 [Pomacea canaliculata]
MPSILDTYGDQPHVRAIIMQMTPEEIMAQASKFGIIVELDADGNIIRSLQDPNGTVFHSVSEVAEENGILYIGSFDQPYVGRLPLTVFPSPETTTVTPPADSSFTTALGRLLETVRKTMDQLPLQTIKDAVIKLVRQLVFAKIDAKKMEETNSNAKAEVQTLRDLIGLPGPMEVALVQSTWQRFLESPNLTTEFSAIFQRMFQMVPTAMQAFRYVNSTDLDSLVANKDLQKVVTMMMSEVNATLQLLDQPQALISLIRSHGARHATYGVTRQWEETMLNAILYAVETKLSPSGFNQSEKNAWRSVLDMLGRNFRQGLEAELSVLPTTQQMELVKTSWTDIVSGAGALQDLTYLIRQSVPEGSAYSLSLFICGVCQVGRRQPVAEHRHADPREEVQGRDDVSRGPPAQPRCRGSDDAKCRLQAR